MIYADRGVSTTTARFVHGITPLILMRLGQGHEQAYISREKIADLTGLGASKILPEVYPKQLAEVGVVHKVSDGQFGLHETRSGALRGIASGWIVDWSGWTPKDLPEVQLVTEPGRFSDVSWADAEAMLDPTDVTWAKEARAHRLACALTVHGGLNRMWVTAKLAAEILGKGPVTSWRALKDLERLGFADHGDGGWWVDLTLLFAMGKAGAAIHPDLHQRQQDHELLRESVFTKAGWEVRKLAKKALEVLAWARAAKERVNQVWADTGGRSLRAAVLYFMRDRERDPRAWGALPEPPWSEI